MLNLQQLNNGETISQHIEKINQNFSQIALHGGGPQGKPGIQGYPGLPGTKGEKGLQGDSGSRGKIIIMADEDSQFPYGMIIPFPDGTISYPAEDAIANGYSVGDIWIENNAGCFYTIVENGSGFVFIEYKLNPATLSSGEFWVSDTEFGAKTNGKEQGVRFSSRYATLSLTGYPYSGTGPASSAPYTSFIAPENGSIRGYRRPAFKLSIDQTSYVSSGSNNIRVTDQDNSSLEDLNKPFLYSTISNDILAPVLFLNSSSTRSGFGFLHTNYIDNDNQNGILSLTPNSAHSMFVVDTTRTVMNSDSLLLHSTSVNDLSKRVSLHDVCSDGTLFWNNTDTWSLFLGLSTQNDITKPPFGSNVIGNTSGIQFNNVVVGTKRECQINFYVHDRLKDTVFNNRKYTPTDLHLQIKKGGVYVTKSLSVGYDTFLDNNGVLISGNTIIGGTSTIPIQDDYPLFDTNFGAPKHFGAPKLSIVSNKKNFSFVGYGNNIRSLVFAVDDTDAYIKSNNTKLVLGNTTNSLYFEGNNLIIDEDSNVGLGYDMERSVADILFGQRLVITKTDYNTSQGLQITTPRIGYGENHGFQFRTDRDDNGEIYLGNINKSIHIFNGGVMCSKMNTNGQVMFIKGGLSINHTPLGNATLDIRGTQKGISNELTSASVITVGMLEDPTQSDKNASVFDNSKDKGQMYIGFNTRYIVDGSNLYFTYRDRPGISGSSGVGSVVFLSSSSGLHVTSYGNKTIEVSAAMPPRKP